MRQDPSTSADVTLSNDISNINQGKGFLTPFTVSALAAAGVYNVSFTTPAASTGKYIHAKPLTLSATANAIRYKIYEGVSFTGGTVLVPNCANRNLNTIPNTVLYVGSTAAVTGEVVVNAKAGGNFANQPAGDAIEVLSDDVTDIGQQVTIYGTKTGATTTVTSETVTLNGTTAVSTTTNTWQNILGVELSASCAGTVTIREASGNLAVTTILTTVLSAGVEIPSSTNARCQVVRHDASGAATTPVGIIGTKYDGTAQSSVDALNGATEEDHNTDNFRTVEKVLIGAVASTVNVTILYPAKMITTTATGTAGGAPARSGGMGGSSDVKWVLTPATSYLMQFTNIGTVTATDIDCTLYFSEEDGY